MLPPLLVNDICCDGHVMMGLRTAWEFLQERYFTMFSNCGAIISLTSPASHFMCHHPCQRRPRQGVQADCPTTN